MNPKQLLFTLYGADVPCYVNFDVVAYITPGIHGNGTTFYFLNGTTLNVVEDYAMVIPLITGNADILSAWKQGAAALNPGGGNISATNSRNVATQFKRGA